MCWRRPSPEQAQDQPRSKAEAASKSKPSSKTDDFRGPFQGPYYGLENGPKVRLPNLDLTVWLDMWCLNFGYKAGFAFNVLRVLQCNHSLDHGCNGRRMVQLLCKTCGFKVPLLGPHPGPRIGPYLVLSEWSSTVWLLCWCG